MTQKAQATLFPFKNESLHFIKIKTLCSKGYYQESEKAANRMGKNFFSAHRSHKSLASRVFKEHLPLNVRNK
jgi:hypothetical protein